MSPAATTMMATSTATTTPMAKSTSTTPRKRTLDVGSAVVTTGGTGTKNNNNNNNNKRNKFEDILVSNNNNNTTQYTLLDLYRLLHVMETDPCPTKSSWQEIQRRVELCQQMYTMAHTHQWIKGMTTSDAQRLKDRVDTVCRQGTDVVLKLQQQQQKEMVVPNNNNSNNASLIQHIFFPTKDQTLGDYMEPSTLPTQPPFMEEQQQQHHVDNNNEATQPRQKRTSAPQRQATATATATADALQEQQREQMEAAVAAMAAQLKHHTAQIHTQLSSQTQHLLSDMETKAEENVAAVTDVATATQQHVSRGWNRTVTTWTVLFTIVAAFIATLGLIFVVPQRQYRMATAVSSSSSSCSSWFCFPTTTTTTTVVPTTTTTIQPQNENGPSSDARTAATVMKQMEIPVSGIPIPDDDDDDIALDDHPIIEQPKMEDDSAETTPPVVQSSTGMPNGMNAELVEQQPVDDSVVEDTAAAETPQVRSTGIPNVVTFDTIEQPVFAEDDDDGIPQVGSVDDFLDDIGTEPPTVGDSAMKEEIPQIIEIPLAAPIELPVDEDDTEPAETVLQDVEEEEEDMADPSLEQMYYAALDALIANDIQQLQTYLDEYSTTSSKLLMATDENGWGLIHEAARAGQTDIVRLLLEYGCNPLLRMGGGSHGTALDLAIQMNGDNHPTVRVLQSAIDRMVVEEDRDNVLDDGPIQQPQPHSSEHVYHDALPTVQRLQIALDGVANAVPGVDAAGTSQGNNIGMHNKKKRCTTGADGECISNPFVGERGDRGTDEENSVKSAETTATSDSEVAAEPIDIVHDTTTPTTEESTTEAIPTFRGRPFTEEEFRRAVQRRDVRRLQGYLEAKPYFVNYADENGWTVLHLAVRDGSLDVIELLLQGGCKTDPVTNTGLTVWDLAQRHTMDSGVSQLLAKYMA